MRPMVDVIARFVELQCMEDAYTASFSLVKEAEKFALLARALPAYSGHPMASTDIEKALSLAVPITIKFTKENWFSASIPYLLPKKSAQSPNYIRGLLYPALRDFFRDREPVRYYDCVLIYRHVFSTSRPDRQRRDYDNVEVKAVTDAIALYVMTDDAPMRCCQYHCSAQGLQERTEIYVVPKADFHLWLDIEKTMTDEGGLQDEKG